GMSGQMWDSGVRLPLSQLAAALDFPIRVDPETGIATGWFINQHRAFTFNAHTLRGQADGKDISAPLGAVAISDDDIYVDTATLAQWFPLDFRVSLSSLEIDIKPREPLPIQQRANRDESRRRLEFSRFGPEAGTPVREPLPYSFLSSPYLGVRQSYQT